MSVREPLARLKGRTRPMCHTSTWKHGMIGSNLHSWGMEKRNHTIASDMRALHVGKPWKRSYDCFVQCCTYTVEWSEKTQASSLPRYQYMRRLHSAGKSAIAVHQLYTHSSDHSAVLESLARACVYINL